MGRFRSLGVALLYLFETEIANTKNTQTEQKTELEIFIKDLRNSSISDNILVREKSINTLIVTTVK